jgi:hypothetical protein
VQASILAHGEDLVSRLPRPWRCSNIRGGVSVSESRYDVYCSRVDSFSSNRQERFTGYLNSVRILRLDSDDLEPDNNFTAKEVATRRRAQMPNLTEIRPIETGANNSTVERTIDFGGQQVVVEHSIYPLQLDPQAEGILTGIYIRSRGTQEIQSHAIQKAQLGTVLSLMSSKPPLGAGILPTHPFAYLHSLELPMSTVAFDIKLEILDRILSICPQLRRLACRILASGATEPALNRIFSKGKHLVSVSLHTNGFLVPHLSALSRFEEVTLVCSTLLRNSDLDLLYGYVQPDRPFIPRLRRFTYGVHRGILDTLRLKHEPCAKPYSVARSIRKLLPRDCVFAASISFYSSHYGLKREVTEWWDDFTGIMDIMMKEIDPPRPAILPLPREP